MSWATDTTTIKIRKDPLPDAEIDVGGNECLLPRANREALMTNNVAMYNKMHERSLYSFEAEFVEMKGASMTGDSLAAKHLNDASALSYVLNLVTERLQQYDLLNLFTKFPVLDMNKITTSEAWQNQFIDLTLWIDELDITVICNTVKWIRQFIDDDPEWNRDLSWSREVLLKACTTELKETIIGEEQALINDDVAFQGGPVTFVLIIKHLSSLNAKALKQLYEYIAHISIKSIAGEDVGKITHQLRTVLKRFAACSTALFVIPPTCYEDIVRIFTTSSCTEFNDVFKALLTQHDLGSPTYTYQRIFDIADDLYRKHQDKWVSSETSSQKGFLGDNRDSGEARTCHVCGKEGHIARDCPTGNTGGVNRMGPEWFKPPDSSQSGCVKVSSDPNHWKKTIDGVEVWWCGKCFTKKTGIQGRWTDKHKRHYTSEHRGGRRGGNPTDAAANIAAAGASVISGITEMPAVAPAAAPSTSVAPSASVSFADAVSNAQRATHT